MAIKRIYLPSKANVTDYAALLAFQEIERQTWPDLPLDFQAGSDATLAMFGGFKNVAGRNGGFEVWQRGTSIAVAASTTAYTCDGWYLKTAANQASVVSRQTGLTSGSQFCARVQRNSGQTGTGVMYFAMPLDIDEIKKCNGNALELIFTVSTGANWSPANGTLTYKVYFGTGAVAKRGGTAYTGETNPISGSVALAQGASAAQVVAAISTTVGTTVSQAEIQFTWTPAGTASTNDWFSVDDLDLRVVPTGLVGWTPTFERTDFVFDLIRCEVYYSKSFPYASAPANSVDDNMYFGSAWSLINVATQFVDFPRRMRIKPTMTFYKGVNGITNGQWACFIPGIGYVEGNITSAGQLFMTGFLGHVDNLTSNAAPGASYFTQGGWTADAGI